MDDRCESNPIKKDSKKSKKQNDNQNKKKLKIDTTQNIMQHISEKFVYKFDYPCVEENGALEITKERTSLLFPEKANTLTPTECYGPIPNIRLFLNANLIFDSDWLPIYSVNDYMKVKDMFLKLYQEYSKAVQHHYYSPMSYSWEPKYYNENISNYKTNNCSIKSLENANLTSIEIDIPTNTIKNANNTSECMYYFNIYIGNHVVLCTQRDLKCLCAADVHFICQFIFHKLTQI
jgi:hypothetical protein